MTLPPSINSTLLARLTARVCSDGQRTEPLREVFTGQTIVQMPVSSEADLDSAFTRARAAQREWASWPVTRRMEVFARFHDLLMSEYDLLVDLMQAETGKARRTAFTEMTDVLLVISHYLKRAPKLLAPKNHPGAVPFFSSTTEHRVPRGVVLVIAPWNYPVALSISDAIPALMAGNGLVLKADHKTPLGPLYCVDMMDRAGLPAGLIQVVHGNGAEVGPPLIDRADFVMFTGSSATGRQVAQQAGRNLTACSLELGGKNPMIVMPDAPIADAVRGAVSGVFTNGGQLCMHVERIYVPDKLYLAFRDAFVQAVKNLKVGATYDYGPDMGSLIDERQVQNVHAHVQDAVKHGATILTGGQPRPDLGPCFYEPTVLEGVTEPMQAATCETFGPVVSLYRYQSLDEAITAANRSEFGLNAAVWGGNIQAAQEVAQRIEAGSVNVNHGFAVVYSSKDTPFGGVKNSGVGVGLPDAGRANIRVEGGRAVVYSATSDIGQGCNTVFQQDVSEATGLPKSAIENGECSTEAAPDSGTTSGSRQTVITGEAVRGAAFLLRDAMLAVERGEDVPASPVCARGDGATIEYDDGTPYTNNHPNDLSAGHAAVPRDPVAALAALEGHEFRYVYFEPTDKLGADKPNPKSHVCYGYATTCVVLGEDRRVSEVYAAHDSGKVVNPIAIQGQIEGGVLMSMGYALTEDFPLRDCVPQARFGTLGLLRAPQIPRIDAIYVEKERLLPVAYGGKGIGEIATIPTAPAIQNAYRRLDGVLRTKLPLGGTPYSRKKTAGKEAEKAQ